MPLLSEVLALVNAYRARHVTLNIETKVEAGAPEQTAPREQFVQAVAAEVRAARLRRPGDDPELRLGHADAHGRGRARACRSSR